MLRTIATFAFSLVLTALSAQDREVQVLDTQAMRDAAERRTEQLERTVGELTPAQREQAQGVFLQVERHMAAVDKRFEGQPKEDKEADMPHIYESMDRYVDDQLAFILTPEQVERWRTAGK